MNRRAAPSPLGPSLAALIAIPSAGWALAPWGCRGLPAAELELVEAGVQAAQLKQFGMRAMLEDPASVEHDDHVGRQHRREPVGDHERGASREQA